VRPAPLRPEQRSRRVPASKTPRQRPGAAPQRWKSWRSVPIPRAASRCTASASGIFQQRQLADRQGQDFPRSVAMHGASVRNFPAASACRPPASGFRAQRRRAVRQRPEFLRSVRNSCAASASTALGSGIFRQRPHPVRQRPHAARQTRVSAGSVALHCVRVRVILASIALRCDRIAFSRVASAALGQDRHQSRQEACGA
jgi:hypothetical protein